MEEATTQPGVAAESMDAWDAAAQGLLAEKPREEAPPQQVKQDPPAAQTDAAKDPAQQDADPKDAPDPNAVDPNNPDPQDPKDATPDDQKSYASLDEFLQEQKLDPESFRSLPVTVKIDGQEKQVPLSDVIKSYQLEGHVNNKSIELSNAQKAFQEEQVAAKTLIQQQVQHNAMMGQLAMQQLTADFQRVDWNTLRATDPGQYAALHADFQQRQQQIQGYIQAVNQQQAQQRQAELAEASKIVDNQRELMLQKNPEWRDESKWNEARTKIFSYAKQLGFSDAELSTVTDHRYMQILRDAASYQALQAAKPETLKKVREAPPLAKAGSRQTTDPQAAQRQAVFQRLKANPKDMDAQAAAFEYFSRG